MQSEIASSPPTWPRSTVVVLGTGGTIAGRAAQPGDNVGYRAGEVAVADLVATLPPLAGLPLECEQVAQLDSKDMDHATWQRLARRAAAHLKRPEVGGLVVTHGTDTLEETAWFLARVLAPAKPVVLTAAMRPATAIAPDGPQNLLDAVRLAGEPGLAGVLVAMAGRVYDAASVRKLHTYRTDAFGAGDAGPLGVMEEGRLRRFREPTPVRRSRLDATAWPDPQASPWPRVEIVLNHAGADGSVVRALLAQGGAETLAGLVVAGTGNATVSLRLEAALDEARARGVAVRLATRCPFGPLLGRASPPDEPAAELSAVQWRVELLLELLEARLAGGEAPAA